MLNGPAIPSTPQVGPSALDYRKEQIGRVFAADLQLVFGWDRVALVVPDRLFELVFSFA